MQTMKTMLAAAWGLALGATLVSPGFAQTEAFKTAPPPAHGRLSGVPFTAVKLTDEFWAPRLVTNRQRSLDHNFKWCEQTGRISNFVKAAGQMPGKFEGIYFNDSDVYKVLEGAAYALADHPDPALAATVDAVVAKIAAAQQPDGYLNSYFTLVEPQKKWTNFRSKHELYCAGHLIEGAVAHYRATGQRNFLDVALKLADHLAATFGPDKRHEVPGHEEVELALVKLYQVTGQQRYLDLAKFFVDVRGDQTQRKEIFGPYCQDHVPVRQQREIVGHAVRAMYLYAGVADVAAYTGDRELVAAMDALWNDVVGTKLYVTGGIGARHQGEAFGDAYELPNDTAYCETCAAIGLALWAQRLGLLHGDARYVDVLEQALYNGILSGVALDGEKFFYVNPLASAGNHHRQPFFGCACCPTNVVRFLPSVPGYVYAVDQKSIYVNLYAQGTGQVSSPAGPVTIQQQTRYPWDGRIELTLQPKQAATWALCLRRPGWCAKPATVTVNGQTLTPPVERGYLRIERSWQPGDRVVLDLPMDVERLEAHPAVKVDQGRVALRRGPVVYCFEAVDNGGQVRNIILAREPKLEAQHRSDLLGGVTVLSGQTRDGRAVTAIPYYAWDHREPGGMAVWVIQDGKSRTPAADDPAWKERLYRPLDPATLGPSVPPTLMEMTQPSSSKKGSSDSLFALNDGVLPQSSSDHAVPRFTWWDHRGTAEWVQYDFDRPAKVASVAVYWFDDQPQKRHCRVPQSWQLLYRDGDQWKPVAAKGPYAVEKDKLNCVSFEPVTTTGLRLAVQLQPTWSGGILEWTVDEK